MQNIDINLILQIITLLTVLGGAFKIWFKQEHKNETQDHKIQDLEKKNIEAELEKKEFRQTLDAKLEKIDFSLQKMNEYIIREDSKQRFADMLVLEFQKHSRSVVTELNQISKHFKQ